MKERAWGLFGKSDHKLQMTRAGRLLVFDTRMQAEDWRKTDTHPKELETVKIVLEIARNTK